MAGHTRGRLLGTRMQYLSLKILNVSKLFIDLKVDVLELLVQNGADVNAKTKNGETPYDICEDPELKERIIQLKNELETKKASHPNRLKRSHSQNTRSHSVRRTSIREKSQIAKREAREEARIRHQKSRDDDDDDSRQTPDIAAAIDTTDSPAPPSEPLPSHQNGYDSENAVDLDNIEFKIESNRKKSIDTESDTVSNQNNSNQIQTQSNANNKEAIVIRNTGYTDQDRHQSNINSSDSPSQSANRTAGAESVKVEIHVTVNTTPTFNSGTLADLKKQRAEKHRNSLSLSTSSDSTTNQRMVESNRNSVTNLPTNAFNNSCHSITTKYMYDTPPSPSTTIKKFRGNASDIVGGSQKKGCCTIV